MTKDTHDTKIKLSQMNFVVSLLSSLTAYTHQPIKAFVLYQCQEVARSIAVLSMTVASGLIYTS